MSFYYYRIYNVTIVIKYTMIILIININLLMYLYLFIYLFIYLFKDFINENHFSTS